MLTYFVIVPILIAVFLYLFPFKKVGRIISILTQVGLTCATFILFLNSRSGEVTTAIGDYGFLGITLRADSLSAMFILLTTFIFLMAAIYNYSSNHSSLFWFLLFIWEASIIGIFLSGDLFNIFVLTEVGTVVVSVLILYRRKKRSMYDGMIYLMINVFVVQFYLLGLGYIYNLAGTLDMVQVTQAFGMLDAQLQVLPYALVMTFVGLKCALLPLFSWLPKAHGTPGASAAVSAVLSGLHIKSGIYMFLRFQDIFAPVAVTNFFLFVGIATALVGVVMSLAQTDIKLVLAYSTIAQVGLIIAGFSIGDAYSYIGSLYHVVTHAVFKSALFLGSGIIIKEYGTRDMTQIRGAWRRIPITSIASGFAILGIIGMPFLGGSVSKYFMMRGAGGIVTALMVLISLGTITIFVKYAMMFFGKPTETAKLQYNDWWQLAPLIVLGILSLMLGLLGEQAILFLFNADKTIVMGSYLEKAAIFVASVVAGCFIFGYYVKDSVLLRRIGKFELGFRGMCAAIGVFFAAMVLYLLI
jgi:multicomponent Na+:H+ antiporter subunit D